jgi:hypothetical protein
VFGHQPPEAVAENQRIRPGIGAGVISTRRFDGLSWRAAKRLRSNKLNIERAQSAAARPELARHREKCRPQPALCPLLLTISLG